MRQAEKDIELQEKDKKFSFLEQFGAVLSLVCKEYNCYKWVCNVLGLALLI